MRNKIEGLISRAKQRLGLEIPTPGQFAGKMRQVSTRVSRHLEHLLRNSPEQNATKLSDVKPGWANTGNNPIGGLADVMGPGGNERINPKWYIWNEIDKLKKQIEGFGKKMEEDENARKIRGIWEGLLLEKDFTLGELPALLTKFAERLESSK